MWIWTKTDSRSRFEQIVWPRLKVADPLRMNPETPFLRGSDWKILVLLLIWRLIVTPLFLVFLPVTGLMWLAANGLDASPGAMTRNDPMWDRTNYCKCGGHRTPALNSLESLGSGTAND